MGPAARNDAQLQFARGAAPEEVAGRLGLELRTARQWYDRWLDGAAGVHYESAASYRRSGTAGARKVVPKRRSNASELGSAAPTKRIRRSAPDPRQPRRGFGPCGTYNGYMRHVRAKEEVCEPCRRARNDYRADLRAAAALANAEP